MIELNSLRIKKLLVTLAFTLLVNARELPPSVYDEMKRGAGEVIVIKVSKASQGDSKSVGQRIQLTMRLALFAIRSQSGLRPIAKITIQSSYYRFGPGEVGPVILAASKKMMSLWHIFKNGKKRVTIKLRQAVTVLKIPRQKISQKY